MGYSRLLYSLLSRYPGVPVLPVLKGFQGEWLVCCDPVNSAAFSLSFVLWLAYWRLLFVGQIAVIYRPDQTIAFPAPCTRV